MEPFASDVEFSSAKNVVGCWCKWNENLSFSYCVHVIVLKIQYDEYITKHLQPLFTIKEISSTLIDLNII